VRAKTTKYKKQASQQRACLLLAGRSEFAVSKALDWQCFCFTNYFKIKGNSVIFSEKNNKDF